MTRRLVVLLACATIVAAAPPAWAHRVPRDVMMPVRGVGHIGTHMVTVAYRVTHHYRPSRVKARCVRDKSVFRYRHSRLAAWRRHLWGAPVLHRSRLRAYYPNHPTARLRPFPRCPAKRIDLRHPR
ncbi:hypothetical protein BH20ACT9_BH20ACT9_15290 [soil metagenome]